MADVRALLKVKRQEAQITHPFASYTSTGQLRCIACSSIIKYASAWEGHLGSKNHRTNVSRLKEEDRIRAEERERGEREQRAQLEQQEAQLASDVGRGKRKAEADDGHRSDPDNGEIKKRRTESSAFPMDFFSDPSRTPITSADDDDTQEAPVAPEDSVSNPIDVEYARFQRELVNGPEFRETYERATIISEPQLASETPEGFPTMTMDTDNSAAEELPNKIAEGELKRQKEEEERELIMDRLLDEERAQEEADMRVVLMKNKLEALRKKRATRSATAIPS